MSRLFSFSLCLALLAGNSVLRAADGPEMPAPQKEHVWLQQFVGEWESEAEIFMVPGQPPVKTKGTEAARQLGGFWILSEGKAEIHGMPFSHLLTLGYDPAKKKYIGTWVDSMSSTLWKYEGTVDATGKILTLEAEGPCPLAPGKLFKFKEVTEFKSKDHKVFTSSMQGEDGKWTTIIKVNSRRKQPPVNSNG